MTNYPATLTATARHLHRLLADRNYDELETISKGKRLTAEDIAGEIRSYGCRVARTPSELDLDVVRIESLLKEWSVYIPIYTEEEGRSDLTLEVTMIESTGQLWNVEIDNLHVL